MPIGADQFMGSSSPAPEDGSYESLIDRLRRQGLGSSAEVAPAAPSMPLQPVANQFKPGAEVAKGGSGAGAVAAGIGPVVGGALIGGITSLLGGLMSAQAQREELRRQRLFQAEQHGLERQGEAARAMGQGQQSAFQQMMQGYGSALR